MSDSKRLNGSVDLLAKAMRQVFQEATQQAVEPVMDEMVKMEDRLDKKIDTVNQNMQDKIDTVNQNMQSQFAEQEKKIGKMVKPDR